MIENTIVEKVKEYLSPYLGKINCICIETTSTGSFFCCNMQKINRTFKTRFEINQETAKQFPDKYSNLIAELLVKYYDEITKDNSYCVEKLVSHNIGAELNIESATF